MIPTRDELLQLPRWARVGFAARAARRVLPLFDRHWPDAPMTERSAVLSAVIAAERISEGQTPTALRPARTADGSNRATVKLGAAKAASAASAAYAASAAAKGAAARSAAPQAAETDDEDATADAYAAAEHAYGAADYDASDSYPIPYDAHANDDEFRAADFVRRAFVMAMRDDFELLRAAASECGWTDDTFVPAGFFGPLFPSGTAPLGEPSCGGSCELVVELELPDDYTDAQVLEAARELADRIDDLHKARGGAGVKINRLEIMQPAPVPQGVPA